MKVVKIVRYLLFPFSILYGMVVWVRHFFYDVGILKGSEFAVPVICVGNVSVGGTGKTPMVEYIVRMLKDSYKVGIVSRGYKRKTEGFFLASKVSRVEELGDEPYQYVSKYKNIVLAVDENRREGIENMLLYRNKTQVIVLDDGLQHRMVKSSYSVLLTPYYNIFTDDFLLPTGDLRDLKSRAYKCDCIIVSKCPDDVSKEEREKIKQKIGFEKVYFTGIKYDKEVIDFEGKREDFLRFIVRKFTLVTGISNPDPLVDFLKKNGAKFEHMNYADHHNFSEQEITILKKEERILTTEKDFVRLKPYLRNVYCLQIETYFLNENEEKEFRKSLEYHILERINNNKKTNKNV